MGAYKGITSESDCTIDMLSHEEYFILAGDEARKATCARGKCGAIIVQNGTVIGRGYNAPPLDAQENCKCDTDYRISLKPKSDRTCCMHAEWRAVVDALSNGKDLRGSTLYFIGVDEAGKLQYSNEPYCTVCSRLALDVGIAYFGLWQKEGFRLFPTKEYNDISYDFHKSVIVANS